MAFLHNRNAIHTLTVGKSGVGKSYYRGIRFLIEEWLPNHDGDFWHNLPLNAQAVAEEAAARCKKPVDVLFARMKKIPGEVEDSWRTGASGPWHFFCGFVPDKYGPDAQYLDADARSLEWYVDNGKRDKRGVIQYPHAMSLSGARLCLDEIQDFCGGDKEKEHRGRWMEFLATFRHMGGTTEAMTQNEKQVSYEYRRQVSCKYELVDGSQERMPYLRIMKGDLQELLAAYLRTYSRPVRVFEYTSLNDAWSLVSSDRFLLTPRYFEFYDTASQPGQGGKGGKEEEHEFQKRSFLGVHAWFFRRNWWQAVSVLLVVSFMYWIVMCGGGGRMAQFIFNNGMATIKASMSRKAAARGESKPDGVTASGGGSASPAGSGPAAAPAAVAIAGPEAAALVAELERIRVENAAWRSRYDEEWTLSEVGRDSIGFRNGDKIKVGETVPDGPLAGEQVVALDWWRRTVLFKSGRVVRMRFDWRGAQQRVQDDYSKAADVTPTAIPHAAAGGGFRGSVPASATGGGRAAAAGGGGR